MALDGRVGKKIGSSKKLVSVVKQIPCAFSVTYLYFEMRSFIREIGESSQKIPCGRYLHHDSRLCGLVHLAVVTDSHPADVPLHLSVRFRAFSMFATTLHNTTDETMPASCCPRFPL